MSEPIARLAWSPAEAAQRLGISRDTVYELCASGHLRSFKAGRLRRITEAALQDYLAEGERGGDAA